MSILGLHWIDAAIIVFYVGGVLAAGRWLSHRVKSENDFFLAGRSLGKWFQFFLNFGNMTDPNQAATTTSSVYRQGAGGVWLGLIPMFMSPFNWFISVWYRRVRLTTTADLFEDRFGKRFLASLYAIIIILAAVITIGLANIVAFQTLAPIMSKAPASYTAAEKEEVQGYQEFVQLRQLHHAGPVSPAQNERYALLKGLYDRNQLQPYISYLSPLPFYLFSSALVGVFIVLGGLQGAAAVDGVQALLVIIISFILIPFGLVRIGGLHGLHLRVPEWKFSIFGGGGASEYTWWSIAAFLLVSLIGTVGATNSMAVNGSAKTEFGARLGQLTGGWSKRFVTIAWCLCGLIAIGLFGPNLADSDQTWGMLTHTLLPVGLIGIMIVGLLGGKLAALGANSIVLSALVARNIYAPLVPGKSDRHYMIAARVAIPVSLILGIIVALYMSSAVGLLKYMIVILVIWGAPIFLIFMWRRVTEMAVRIEMITCLILLGVVPLIVPMIPAARRAESTTVMTRGPEPIGLFFDEGVALKNPKDPNSPREGMGLFNVELYLLSRLGVDLRDFSPAGLLTARYLVDSALPFLLLFTASWLTKPADPLRAARFYARMKTPVEPDPAADARAVEESYANLSRFDHTKLFPRSNWEFTKWSKIDALGFIGIWASVGVILLIFKGVMTLGS